MPDSNYQLDYGSVDSAGGSGANFSDSVVPHPGSPNAINSSIGMRHHRES
jgi:hypothetical protein